MLGLCIVSLKNTRNIDVIVTEAKAQLASKQIEKMPLFEKSQIKHKNRETKDIKANCSPPILLKWRTGIFMFTTQ